MDVENAIAESLLLERCRLEQRSHIYCAADGRRVYFFAGLFGRGCLVEDMGSFSLLRARHQQVREWAARIFLCLFLLLRPTLLSTFPEFRKNSLLVPLAAWLLIPFVFHCLQARALYRRFGPPASSPSWRERREQRRAVAAGHLPAPLRGMAKAAT